MPIRMSGLVSGMDTEALISELVSAYSTKTDKYVKAQTKLSWKQDAWKALNTKIHTLYNNVSSLRFSSAYSLKTTSVSDSTKATITASSSAVNGTQTLKITSLAKSGYLTGGKLNSSGETLSERTKLSELGYAGGSGTISVNGTSFSVNGDSTISEVLSSMRSAGVTASLDAANGRIFVSSSKSGASNEFSLTGADEAGQQALQAMGLSVASDSGSAAMNAVVEKYGVFTDNDGNVVNAADYDLKYDEVEDAYYLADDSGMAVAIYDEAATKSNITAAIANGTYTAATYGNSTYSQAVNIYNYASQALAGDMTLIDKYNAYHTAKENVTTVQDSMTTDELKQFDVLAKATEKAREDANYDSEGHLLSATTDKDGNKTYSYKNAAGETVEVAAEDVITGTEYYNQLKAKAGLDDEGVTAYQDNLKTISEYEGNSLYSVMEAVGAAAAEGTASLQQLANDNLDLAADTLMSNVNYSMSAAVNGVGYTSEGAVRVNGADATIELNGVEFTSTTNQFVVNGLTINATALTGSADEDALTITTATDTTGIYNKVKDFLKEYNTLVNEMTNLYNASSSRGYEPLTTEEKEAMSDTEVEEWEKKIKDSLLRRDSTLDGVLNAMTSSMSQSYYIKGETSIAYDRTNKYYTVNGTAIKDSAGNNITNSSQLAEYAEANGFKRYSASSFGISTLGYLSSNTNEYNAYHIDGDSEDSITGTNTDKLMAAIESDPDTVLSFMKSLTSGLYTAIDNKMKSSSLSSAYTVYNDKQMAQEYSDYTTTISDWEDKVAEIEDSYYAKFTAMETALANLQSQTSALSGLLGSS